MTSLSLHVRDYDATRDGTPVVLLHGFLGSGVNWHSIARRLNEAWPVLVPDLRNHGQSPHATAMDYPAMAADLAALFEARGIERAVLVGHSMGGKLAMEYALRHPDQVARLVAVDIAPVRYHHGFEAVFRALRAVDLARIASRRDADAMMQPVLETEGLRQFLLQNLEKTDAGWRWRIDLDILQAAVPVIQDAPPALEGRQFEGPARFLYGARSDYVTDAAEPLIRRHFPQAGLEAIPAAGHWVYAEQPQAFLEALWRFLERGEA
ncbi:MAG TPA: alpha/beta fold hydrolase [Thioalkalivibrio sp.]|nr:alpha/beta fold hydrolase [Thioalkalivibrio sp.]